MKARQVIATAGDRFRLGAARIESSSVLVERDVAEDWAPRHGSHATPGLVGIVQSEDAEVRKVGLWTLAVLPFQQADPRIVSVMRALSRDPDVDVRRAAVESAMFTASPGDDYMLAALADRLLVDEDFSVRRSAAEAIGKLVLDRHTHLGNACRVLEAHLPQVFDIIVRFWAPRRRDGRSEADHNIDTIKFSADELVASVQTAGLDVSDKEIRGVFALATPHKLCGHQELVPAISATAAKIRLPEFVLEALVRALMDAHASVRTVTLKTLKHVTAPGDPRATRILVECVEKGLGAMRSEVVDALTAAAKPGDLRVTMALATATEDPRATIRSLALSCLAQHVDLTDASSREMAAHAAAVRSIREETDTGVRKMALRLLSQLDEGSGEKAKGGGGGRGGGVGKRSTWISQSRRDSIEERLLCDDSQQRYMAAREAGIIAETLETPERRAILLEKVIERLRADEDAAVRRAAIEATANLVSRSLKDAQNAGAEIMTTTLTSPSSKKESAAADSLVMVDMVIKVLIERMQRESVDTTRLMAVEMLRKLSSRGNRLVLAAMAERVSEDPSVEIRKSIMISLGQLMSDDDGQVDMELIGLLNLDEILLARSICVEECVATRKLAKALLHRLHNQVEPPQTGAESDTNW